MSVVTINAPQTEILWRRTDVLSMYRKYRQTRIVPCKTSRPAGEPAARRAEVLSPLHG